MSKRQPQRGEEQFAAPSPDGWEDFHRSAASPESRTRSAGPREGNGGFAEVRGRKLELLDEFRSDWEDGNAPRPEELLPRWPGDPEEDPDVASLLFEDFLRRRHTEST